MIPRALAGSRAWAGPVLLVLAASLAPGCRDGAADGAEPGDGRAASDRAEVPGTEAAEPETGALAARMAATLLPVQQLRGGAAGSGTGSVRGVARWAGSTPLKVKQLTNTTDVAACGERVNSGSLVATARGELANVVIELRAADATARLAEAASRAQAPGPLVVATITRCVQEPHVLIVPVGAAVEVRNQDAVLHDVIGLSVRNPPFTLTLPRYRRRARLEADALTRAERIQVTCDIHPWAVAWWVVSSAPHRALTGLDGRFTLADVPAGTWRLVAWHEEFGEIERTVTVRAGATAEAELAWR